jgi:hypothetical protein
MECGKECSGQRCMDCFKKTQVFRVGNLEFANKRELDLIIKQQIKEAPRNIEFSSEFFRTIINELHEDVKRRNFKVTKFKILDWYGQVGKWEFCRDRFRGGVFVLGFFEPINEWHGVTLYPHKREKDNIKKKLIDSLRQKWSEHAKKRDKDAVCQNCGNPFPHLHHDNISFNEIALNCLEFFSEQELEKGIGDDWWLHENEADAIPNDHPAVLEMLKLHKEVKYKWLCSKCHYKEHNGY